MAELRALMRQHFAHVEEMIQERRDRPDVELVLGKSALRLTHQENSGSSYGVDCILAWPELEYRFVLTRV